MFDNEEPVDDNKKDMYDRLSSAMDNAASNGEMIIKWTSVIEVIDSNGDRGIWTLSSESAAPWDILGMLQYAVNREQNLSFMERFVTEITSEEDEDE